MARNGPVGKGVAVLLGIACAGMALAQTPVPPAPPTPPPSADMSPEQMAPIILRIDPEARLEGNVWEFALDGTSLALVFDVGADRMRLMLPVAAADELTEPMLRRLLQANFDTALDARYAIARDTLWATFIHPLSPLTEQQLLSAISQTISIARTYGSTFSSGVWAFGGGDASSGEATTRPRSGT
ncbi:MAG: type III secretion system chaperone [Pseudomonadota bacterium]